MSTVLFLLLLLPLLLRQPQLAGAVDCRANTYAKWSADPTFRSAANRACDGRNELGIFLDLSRFECGRKCVDDSDCISYEYNPSQRKCQLSNTCSRYSNDKTTQNWNLYYLTAAEQGKSMYCASCETGKSTDGNTGQTTKSDCKLVKDAPGSSSSTFPDMSRTPSPSHFANKTSIKLPENAGLFALIAVGVLGLMVVLLWCICLLCTGGNVAKRTYTSTQHSAGHLSSVQKKKTAVVPTTTPAPTTAETPSGSKKGKQKKENKISGRRRIKAQKTLGITSKKRPSQISRDFEKVQRATASASAQIENHKEQARTKSKEQLQARLAKKRSSQDTRIRGGI